ncbi:MAG: hypothetical protein KJT03_12035 [Verrucomicrobiae bacterium]|nr:hypothetical protein [Verrucomicrobiae bacterium]
MKRIFLFICFFCLLSFGLQAIPPYIDVWYGKEQSFGHLGGHPQRWINVLGHVSPGEQIASLFYTLNGSESRQLSYKEDSKRIARTGDFNVEILTSELLPGKNDVRIVAAHTNGETSEVNVSVINYTESPGWPLPYEIDWSQVDRIQDVAQVVDGKWILTGSGARCVERYYDRVLAFGDDTWVNYEVQTTVTVHAVTPPKSGPNTTNVSHAAIATRWPGHDPDGNQPTVKWHPLGATAEFRLGADLTQCRWRVFDGQRDLLVESDRRRKIEFEKPYHMKHRVETLENGHSWFRVKLWPVGEEEPESWDLERLEEQDDVPQGSALLLGHFADVTFGNVQVVPVNP